MKKIFYLFLIPFFYSCGIDDFIYLAPPSVLHTPTGQTDENQTYFEFLTSDAENMVNQSTSFKGFDIFYRIYDNENTCSSAISSILTYNNSNPTNAADYLLSTHKFKFLTVKGKPSVLRPLITLPSSPSNRRIRFRLLPYGTQKAVLTIDLAEKGNVLRHSSSDFNLILKSDDDVSSSNNNNADNKNLFVAVFAAAYGSDTSFKGTYSALISLGYAKLPKPETW